MAALVDGLLTLARADAGRLDVARFKAVDLGASSTRSSMQYQGRRPTPAARLESLVDEWRHRARRRDVLARVVEQSALQRDPLHAARRPRAGVIAAAGRAARIGRRRHRLRHRRGRSASGFRAFFRADKAHCARSGGNGLGLAICKTLVEAHGGTIRFSSRPQQGASFEVRCR